MEKEAAKREISVVMPVYNTRPEWLRAAVESILGQTYENFEFIVILDAPTDDSEKIMEEYASKDSRIKVIKNKTNEGITESLNKGIRKSSADIIARMDSDDIAVKDRLQIQYRYLKANKMDLVGSRIMPVGEEGEVIGKASAAIDEKKITKILKYVNCISHPTWMMRRELFDALGGYRNVFACEDYDFLIRAGEQKAALGMCDEVLLMLRCNPESITHTNALPQFLMTLFLQKKKKHISTDEIIRAEKVFLKKSTPEERQKFVRTNAMASKGINEIRNRKILCGACSLIKAGTASRYAPAYAFNQLIAKLLMMK